MINSNKLITEIESQEVLYRITEVFQKWCFDNGYDYREIDIFSPLARKAWEGHATLTLEPLIAHLMEQLKLECIDADRICHELGMEPEFFRTEAGNLHMPRIMQHIHDIKK
jgi:hypothetical protein